jgi:hypothetical protein
MESIYLLIYYIFLLKDIIETNRMTNDLLFKYNIKLRQILSRNIVMKLYFLYLKVNFLLLLLLVFLFLFILIII